MPSTRILDGVVNVLADRGSHALSIRSVAAEAGVSPAQVQYYYRTRAELVRAGFDHAGEQFLADIAAARPSTLMDVVEQWLPLDSRREHRARVWLAYAAMSSVDEHLAAESARLDGELRQWFMQQGISEEAAAHLFALIDGVTVQCLMVPMAERRFLVDRALTPLVTELEKGLDGAPPR